MNHEIEQYIIESSGKKILEEIRPDEKEKFFSKVRETYGFQKWKVRKEFKILVDEILIALRIRKRK